MKIQGSARLTAIAKLSGTAHTRPNFSLQHMQGAAKFARLAKDIEITHKGQPFGNFFSENMMVYVPASILSAAAAVEAYINELFSDSKVFFPEYQAGNSSKLWEMLWNEIEQKRTLEKYDIALELKNQPPFIQKESDAIKEKKEAEFLAYRSANKLFEVRNALVHFKPQWENERKTHRKLTDKLRQEKIQTSPFVSPPLSFPLAYMSHDMAKWAVTTSLEFIEVFSVKAGLNNKFSKHLATLDPS